MPAARDLRMMHGLLRTVDMMPLLASFPLLLLGQQSGWQGFNGAQHRALDAEEALKLSVFYMPFCSIPSSASTGFRCPMPS